MTIFLLITLISIALYIVYLIKKQKPDNSEEIIGEIIELSEKITESKTLTQTVFQGISDEISRTRVENIKALNDGISSLNSVISSGFEQISSVLKNSSGEQRENLKNFADNLNALTKTIDEKLKDIMNNNEKKLEEMRKTVDEKLQSTLEKRLGESFKAVSAQLENVYKGIGEMSRLASDVGDLKRVLTNVKQRGVFGELQLKKILEDLLTKEQYVENANIKKGSFVEFAIKIPSKNEEGKNVLLPVDSKYPREDYEKILQAQEKADSDLLNEAVKSLETKIKSEAKDIHDKYIDPPNTTDFAILFLPVEGLFAEVLRVPGLFEKIRNDYGVIITGPTTITAILNSLQMGFRTLAIEKKSHEVWRVLSAVKTEFIKFGDYLSKTRKKLEDAASEIERAEKRTSIIGKKLRNIETITPEESREILRLDAEVFENDEDEPDIK